MSIVLASGIFQDVVNTNHALKVAGNYSISFVGVIAVFLQTPAGFDASLILNSGAAPLATFNFFTNVAALTPLNLPFNYSYPSELIAPANQTLNLQCNFSGVGNNFKYVINVYGSILP